MDAHSTEKRPVVGQIPSAGPVPPPEHTVAVKKSGARKIIVYTVLLAAVVVGMIYGYRFYTFSQSHVETDNAQIDGHIDPVLPRVSGYVTEVAVNDNDMVTQGQPIIQIDPRELQIKLGNTEAALHTAEVGLETARAAVTNAEATLAVARANVKTAQVANEKTANDLARDKNLLAGGAITRQQFDATTAAHDATAAQLETAQRQVQVAEAQVEVARSQIQSAQSLVAQRQNDIDYARLQLSYTKIVAPATGRVSKKNVEVGQLVQSGQPLLAITEDSTVWVTANFKETDMEEIRIGAPAEIEVDGYPDARFPGTVESIAAATGAKFSLLPPDNATGNFVKVTQRVPVKIALTGKPSGQYALRPGMSANVVITVQ